MKYSIVIPTYNKCDEFLKPCIESIFKYTDMTDVELVISANGCTDNTGEYLGGLQNRFNYIGFEKHFKIIWNDKPLGYPKATNEGIKATTGDYIILLNNDTVLLEQPKNLWIDLLFKPFLNLQCGISGPLVSYSPEANHNFAVFFCVMIDRRVFNTIGILNEEYGVGSGEDTEFCIEANRAGFLTIETGEKHILNDVMYTGFFPIYHKGEGTVHDESLVPEFREVFKKNGLRLARKYNREFYKRQLENNFERHLSMKGEAVPQREMSRYLWARDNLVGKKVLEIGCSNGYGSQFLPDDIEYTGIDYDDQIVEVAREEGWGDNKKFVWADINTYDLEQYDTIIAFEVVEHLDNGLEIVQKLKQHCKRLLITVPYMEPPGFWGEHHKLHMLNESHLPGFEYYFCDEYGNIDNKPIENSQFNLMLCKYDAK
jgi:glycosyltransferase involved in cell wall biosynthesis